MDLRKVEVVVMIGPSGSGKSTYANKNYVSKGYTMISRDIIRWELGFCEEGEKFLGTPEQEEAVTFSLENKLIDCVNRGKNVVIDNTHLKKKYRDRIHDLLKAYNVKYTYVVLNVNEPSTLYKRRRDDFGENVERIIDNMLRTFEYPSSSEYDELITVNSDN